MGTCLALLLLGPGEERALQLGDEDVKVDVFRTGSLLEEPAFTASFALTDRLRIYSHIATTRVPLEELFGDPDLGFRPASAGGLRLDGGLAFSVCTGWSLTGGYTRLATDLTPSSSKDDRLRAMLDGGGYILGFELKF